MVAKRNRAGFTLIELLVVMAIIATLLTIATPRYTGSLDRSKEVVLKQSLGVMRDAIDKFHGDSGHYPESLEELVTKRYLRKLPVDPITDSASMRREDSTPGVAHAGTRLEARLRTTLYLDRRAP